MKNNKGIGKFELLTMLLIFMVAFVLVLWYFIGVANRERYNTMRKSASSMSQTLATNMNSFHNTAVAYLGEGIREGFISAVSSPFSGKNCSISESKVVIKDGKQYVTLKCDNYLIDNQYAIDYESFKIYKVSDWQTKKPIGKYEKKVLYNCLDGGKEKYDEYTEELYFVSNINNDYGKEYYDVKSMQNECDIVTKTFYRTKKLIK